jgi:hypothetical protein
MNRSKFFFIISSILLVLSFTVIGAAWVTKYSHDGGSRFSTGLNKWIISVADFPNKVYGVLKILRNQIQPAGSNDPYRDVLEAQAERPKTSGYILIPYVDQNGLSQIILVDLLTKAERVVFSQNISAEKAAFTDTLIGSSEYRQSAYSSGHRVSHPYLTNSGLIYYILPWNDLVCFDTNIGKEVWRVEGAFHHSLEIDSEGNIWACGALAPGVLNPKNQKSLLSKNFEDQALVKISSAGVIIDVLSVSDLLTSSGNEYLLYGCSNPLLNADPIHLNHAYPVKSDFGLIKKGSILVSLRNISTILLVDPVLKKIIWNKTGPWMNQHCVIPVGDSRISVLDNHAFSFGSGNYFLDSNWKTRVLTYNLASNEIHDVDLGLHGPRIQIPIEGRAIPTPNGSWIIEDSVHGTIFLIENQKIVLKWVNSYSNGKVGHASWCRFMSADEVPEKYRFNK